MTEYIIDLKGISDCEVFPDASREELRVLLAIISKNGRIDDPRDLASLAHTSKARALASVVFWQEAGILSESATHTERDNVRDEYAPKENAHSLMEESSVDVAKTIKDEGLASLLSECAHLMGRPTLSTTEAKKIVAVYTQYALGEEFIITLAAYLAEQKKLTAVRLATDAEHLVKQGVDCVEALEIYIAKKMNQSAAELEFMRFLKIYNRPLSDAEKAFAEKWFCTFGFSTEIVGLAYNITTTNKSDLKYSYMDSLLTSWYEAGCKTVEDCKAQNEKFIADWKTEKCEEKKPQKKAKEKPRYGDFDVTAAFAKALERSYGEDDTEN